MDVFVANSDPLNVKTERRWNAECNTMAKKRLDRDEPGRAHRSLWVVGVATQWTLCSTQGCSQRLAEQCTARQTCGGPSSMGVRPSHLPIPTLTCLPTTIPGQHHPKGRSLLARQPSVFTTTGCDPIRGDLAADSPVW